MRPSGAWGATPSAWSVLLLLATLLCTATTVFAKDEPTIAFTEFENPPNNLNYFKDSNIVLFQESYGRTIWRSTDAGATWSKVDGIEHDKAVALVMHEFDKERAYILTLGNLHWRTHDSGKTWEEFFTYAYLSDFAETVGRWLVFHADDKDKILFNGMECEGFFCEELVMYTKDGFSTEAAFLRGRTQGCWWAKSSDIFTTGQHDLNADRILCIIRESLFAPQEDNRLFISDNYFEALGSGGVSDGVIQEKEANLNGNGPVRGIVSLVEVKKYLLAATTSQNSLEMALFVTDDTETWHRAIFPHDHPLLEAAYTVLESTNYSIQIDVRTSRRMSQPMGTLLTSNSNGTYFTRNMEHTNRNFAAYVDFEKVSGIQGIFLVNQVDNWEAVEEDEAEKKVKTLITFDDGRTFEPVTVGDDRIHLHSVTELDNVGPVFSSPAPGLVMGNGNPGGHLEPYGASNLYVSDDAGRTWKQGPNGPHKYEFGDQGSILLAVEEGDDVYDIKYSLDHGQTWNSTALPKEIGTISPWALTTTQDSTSLRFLLTARKGPKESSSGYYIISIDFEGMHEDKCTEDDMEDWWARVDDDGKPTCVMGHTQKYHRRKKTAKCFVKEEFRDPVPVSPPCDCTDADFECDFNFVRDGDECKPVGPILVPDDTCKDGDPEKTFKGSGGWRLIPGNQCKRTSGEQKDKQKEWKCSDAKMPPTKGNGEIEVQKMVFPGDYDVFEKHYLERGDFNSQDDETIIARPYKAIGQYAGDVFVTHNHGKNWTTPKALKGESIYEIISHPYVKDTAFFLTMGEKVYYTTDRARTIDSFKLQIQVDTSQVGLPLAFHPDRPEWLIWHGKHCPDSGKCYREAQISFDRGDNWQTLRRHVDSCQFTGSSAYKFRNATQIVCSAREHGDNDDADNPLQLLYTDEFPKYPWAVALENVLRFATMAEFIVVATENQTEGTLNALASVDGRDYAAAHFPYNFEVPHKNAYTVLDSSTHAVNLFVATGTEQDRQHGAILKSNSNGTSYVMSVQGVNCDSSYYVDFEKMLGLEGVVLVNTVANLDSASEPKKLQTRISHNDGANWAFLPPPAQDANKKGYSCSSKAGDEACALHLHGYTERVDHRKTYSSESAVGLMFGIGNVGPVLGDAKDADTFMTTDAGVHWKEVKKGSWAWSFGDQGSIVVLAQRNVGTKSISYSLDYGDTWEDKVFSEDAVVITDITTLRSGSSRNFILWGHKGDELFTVNLDFSGLADRPCEHDEADASKSDYETWTPAHPSHPNECLFGHKNKYLRKKSDRSCYNDQKLQHVYSVENCECTQQDYECDYNYEMDNHGYCKLVNGLEPLDPERICREDPDATEYYEPSGFRRIPLTTCAGGVEADKINPPHPCPGHEDEFEKKHSASGVAIFFAVVIPVALASLVGWWVYRNWSSNFGQIRLGEQGSFDHDSPLVKYTIVAVSAVVAVVGALPLLAGSLWRSVSSLFGRGDSGGSSYSWLRGGSQRRFTTRDSFARGRGDYAIADEDEGELLGDDSDEEV
ncbi:Uu.00g014650.m01.CDS01 [Anthostomella pinea]|uniref:Vacuolar protein sorting/targeting protein 10 n=1 Tax=Anthostomella pinea TaxID=933095 RepID=A0AAI8VSL5_9PEZI|nr:Uu.00g014650.m01.CDS01 [Anthostomella pinea]